MMPMIAAICLILLLLIGLVWFYLDQKEKRRIDIINKIDAMDVEGLRAYGCNILYKTVMDHSTYVKTVKLIEMSYEQRLKTALLIYCYGGDKRKANNLMKGIPATDVTEFMGRHTVPGLQMLNLKYGVNHADN